MNQNKEISWQESLYKKTFDEEFLGLERRLKTDSACNVEDMESTLKHFYDMEGADWLGRGEVQSITLSATIAAYESFLENLKKGETGERKA
jgi:hypothetical protein